MKVETLSEKYINEIGHAFGYYEYAQGEKGLVSASVSYTHLTLPTKLEV